MLFQHSYDEILTQIEKAPDSNPPGAAVKIFVKCAAISIIHLPFSVANLRSKSKRCITMELGPESVSSVAHVSYDSLNNIIFLSVVQNCRKRPEPMFMYLYV